MKALLGALLVALAWRAHAGPECQAPLARIERDARAGAHHFAVTRYAGRLGNRLIGMVDAVTAEAGARVPVSNALVLIDDGDGHGPLVLLHGQCVVLARPVLPGTFRDFAHAVADSISMAKADRPKPSQQSGSV